MQYLRLGSTGLTVSRLCLGTMTFGLQVDEANSHAILDRASAGGINFIDSADVYPLGGSPETVGRTEEIVGRWLSGKRHQFIVATKAVGKTGGSPWDQGASRKHLLDAVDASLQRLGVDYIDLYQLHSDDRNTPLDETLGALDTIVRSGKARYIGISNVLAYRLARALGRADVLGTARYVSVQPRYSLLFRELERELLPLAQEEGLGVIPYNPLAGGLLTGKHAAGTSPTPGTRFTLGSAAKRYQERYWHEREFQTVSDFTAIATEIGLPPVTAAIAWVLAHPAVTAPIIGASRPDQLTDSLAAVDVKLDPAIKSRLDEISAGYRRGDSPR
jgi:1-deoxyxylulose-5-phosphate synthase